MKTMSWILLVTMTYYVSCSSTRLVQHTEASYQDVNQELEKKKVKLVMVNGKTYTSDNVKIVHDSISLGVENLAIKDVKEIQIKNHVDGFSTGMEWGGILGGLFGVFVGAASEAKGSSIDPVKLASIVALTGIIIGGVYGGVTGLPEYLLFAPYRIDDTTSVSVSESGVGSFVRVEISTIVEKTGKYITVLWQGKQISLLRTEYSYRGTTADGKQFIIVQKEIYKSKFKSK